MAPVESQHLVNARGSTVWDILTDSGKLTVWDSGITTVSGEIRNGATIRIRTRHGGDLNFRVRVEQIPGEIMTWTRTVPPGAAVRTFVLARQGSMTLLLVRDEVKGPLRRLIRSPFSSSQQNLDQFVDAVRKRAEIIG